MIVRTSHRCRVCGTGHILRLGMGHDERHTYRVPCTSCGEEMAVTLTVDYVEISTRVDEEFNAEAVPEETGFAVVNLHANFLIPEDERFVDCAFPHLPRMEEAFEAAQKAGSLVDLTKVPEKDRAYRPYRRPDFASEWYKLRRAWALHRRGKDRLVAKILRDESKVYYGNDPLSDVPDWLWRFCLFSSGVAFQEKFKEAVKFRNENVSDAAFGEIMEHYSANLARRRSQQYFDILNEYFGCWSDFSQVHFDTGKGLSPVGLTAGTAGFARVRMYYGNAFEIFASLVDLLVMVNNAAQGRAYTQLANIALADYLKSDKGKRFDALDATPAFASLCEERDNGLRNASHHGDLKYDEAEALISYNVGKGGSGREVTLPYSEYLSRCAKLHRQIVALLMVELIWCQQTSADYPI